MQLRPNTAKTSRWPSSKGNNSKRPGLSAYSGYRVRAFFIAEIWWRTRGSTPVGSTTSRWSPGHSRSCCESGSVRLAHPACTTPTARPRLHYPPGNSRRGYYRNYRNIAPARGLGRFRSNVSPNGTNDGRLTRAPELDANKSAVPIPVEYDTKLQELMRRDWPDRIVNKLDVYRARLLIGKNLHNFLPRPFSLSYLVQLNPRPRWARSALALIHDLPLPYDLWSFSRSMSC